MTIWQRQFIGLFSERMVRRHTQVGWTGPGNRIGKEEAKLLWDTNVQCDNVIEARRPDIIIVVKKEHKGLIIDIAVSADVNAGKKEKQKVDKIPGLE